MSNLMTSIPTKYKLVRKYSIVSVMLILLNMNAFEVKASEITIAVAANFHTILLLIVTCIVVMPLGLAGFLVYPLCLFMCFKKTETIDLDDESMVTYLESETPT